MKTEHRCTICGFSSVDIAAVTRCEWLGRHNHYRIDQEVTFLHNIQGSEWELVGTITGVTFLPNGHKPIYTIAVSESGYPKECLYFEVTEEKILNVLPHSSNLRFDS